MGPFFKSSRVPGAPACRRLFTWGLPDICRGPATWGRRSAPSWLRIRPGLVRMESPLCPRLDQGLSSLLEDLQQRGLLSSTLVVVTGEFGRTPRINQYGGRDHWPQCFSVLLAGGGIPGGTVVGASDNH